MDIEWGKIAGGSNMTDLPMEPSPPSMAPDSGVVVLGRLQPFHLGHEYMLESCLLYTSPSPRDQRGSRMPSSA